MKMYGKAEETAQRIIDAFQNPAGLPAALAPIFIKYSGADQSPCRSWSWHNQMLVALSGSTDARGFKQWQDVKRKVKKGAKAVYILAPMTKKVQEPGKDDRVIVFGFRGLPVFRLEDTEGEPLPGQEESHNHVLGLPLLDVAKSWGLHVGTYAGRPGSALGWYQFGGFLGGQQIALGVQNLSTWAHELCHAADHRLVGRSFAADDRAMKEIVAEFAGAVLLSCLGQDHDADLGGAYEYISHWAAENKKSPIRGCLDVLDRVARVVSLILDTAAEIEQQQQQPAAADEVA